MHHAAKRKTQFTASLTAVRLLLLLIVACCGLETRLWSFAATPPTASGEIALATPSFIGEIYVAPAYDASDSLVAAKGIPRVTETGLARVEGHLDDVLRNQFPEFSRADQLRFQAGERGMLDRLRSGATSSQDIEFYMHELKESARFRATGNLMDSHNAALQWRGVTSQDLFHPEVIRANPSVFSPSWQP